MERRNEPVVLGMRYLSAIKVGISSYRFITSGLSGRWPLIPLTGVVRWWPGCDCQGMSAGSGAIGNGMELGGMSEQRVQYPSQKGNDQWEFPFGIAASLRDVA